jgi:hypothetical protein
MYPRFRYANDVPRMRNMVTYHVPGECEPHMCLHGCSSRTNAPSPHCFESRITSSIRHGDAHQCCLAPSLSFRFPLYREHLNAECSCERRGEAIITGELRKG